MQRGIIQNNFYPALHLFMHKHKHQHYGGGTNVVKLPPSPSRILVSSRLESWQGCLASQRLHGQHNKVCFKIKSFSH